jgi:hypothetical protein
MASKASITSSARFEVSATVNLNVCAEDMFSASWHIRSAENSNRHGKSSTMVRPNSCDFRMPNLGGSFTPPRQVVLLQPRLIRNGGPRTPQEKGARSNCIGIAVKGRRYSSGGGP